MTPSEFAEKHFWNCNEDAHEEASADLDTLLAEVADQARAEERERFIKVLKDRHDLSIQSVHIDHRYREDARLCEFLIGQVARSDSKGAG